MFIAILDLRTAPADRPAARDQLQTERAAVRGMPGCVDFRVFESGECDTDLVVLHEWEDEDSFRAYLASAAFERSGQVVRPLLTAPPISRRFRAELAELV